jgi:hypothetical protein
VELRALGVNLYTDLREFTPLIDYAPEPQRRRESAGKIWREALLGVSTQFGRLVYLASLRDSTSGYYCEPGLTKLLGTEGADRAIRHSHYQVFSEWLAYSLAEQKADIDDFLRGQGLSAGQPFNWSASLPYRSVIPPAARDVERQLYLADLETLLELLKAEHAVAFSGRET